MVPRSVTRSPSYQSFIHKLNSDSLEASIVHLISLIKRRQIEPPYGFAFATVRLLAQSLADCGSSDPVLLVNRVKLDGRRLIDANPRQIVVGNIVRRVLGIVKDEIDELRREGHLPPAGDSRPVTPQSAAAVPSVPSPLRHGESESGDANGASEATRRVTHIDTTEKSLSRASSQGPKLKPPVAPVPAPPPVSMFDLLAHPEDRSPQPKSPTSPSNDDGEPQKPKDLLKESLSATNEFMDELDQADDQIASYALDHIHSNEVILTYSASETVQTFLLRAAAKRKFTVMHVESYPNYHRYSHATGGGSKGESDTELFQKKLARLGIKVTVIPDTAIFAIMSRVNKVVLSTHSVLVNGGLIADSGTGLIAHAARVHQIPTVVLSAVYKLCPKYPFDPEALVEYTDPTLTLSRDDQSLLGKMDIFNPLTEYVPPELVDLYITNLGAHAPTYLARVISDHYRNEDINL